MLIFRGGNRLTDYIEYSDRLAYIILGGIILLFCAVESHEITEYENVYGAFEAIKTKILPNCSYVDSPFSRGSINWYVVCLGHLTFENSRIVPFMISGGMIPMTFLLIRKFSNNLIGLLVSGGLALDLTFLVFDSVPAFAQTWALFFISSVYFIKKSALYSGISFWLACMSKVLAIAWIPIIIWIILKVDTDKKKQMISFLSIIPVFVVSIVFFQGWTFYSGFPFMLDFSYERLLNTISWMAIAFRWEWHLVFSIPVLFGYYGLMKWKGIPISITPYLVGAFGIASVFLTAYFTKEGYFPYRLIPNIIMMLYTNAYTIRHIINSAGKRQTKQLF